MEESYAAVVIEQAWSVLSVFLDDLFNEASYEKTLFASRVQDVYVPGLHLVSGRLAELAEELKGGCDDE